METFGNTYTETIPFETLDKFYFQQIVGQLPPSLRELATDSGILLKLSGEPQINSISDFILKSYMITPWIIDDIFAVSSETALLIGQAHIPIFMAYLITDNLVDQQLPDNPLLPLLPQYMLLKAGELFSQRFEFPAPFWEKYHNYLIEWTTALAIESSSMDSRVQPYTYDIMQLVCTGKAAPLRNVAYSYALCSNDMAPLDTLNFVFNKLLMADQLSDDAVDWLADFQAGRYTLPSILALESEEEPLDATLDFKEFEARIYRHGILVGMLEKAISELNIAQLKMEEAGFEKKKLFSFLEDRVELMEEQKRCFYAACALDWFANALKDKIVVTNS